MLGGCDQLTAITNNLFAYNVNVTTFEWALRNTKIVDIPEGLFDNKLEIPNDAKFIFEALENYYS